MKKLFLLFVASLTIFATSCKKDDIKIESKAEKPMIMHGATKLTTTYGE
ncbi:hypothetical protein [Pedobacter glucosidilyticus]|nr:hypothetical protein [Pedobacter glucosidilyticus]